MRRQLTVVSKEGCGLCEKVIVALNSFASTHDFDVAVLYIDDDRGLHDKYWLAVPAVLVDGKDAFDARHLGGEANLGVMLEQLLRSYDSALA